MTVDPRAALDRFVAALEAHYTAVANRRGDDDAKVDDAFDILEDAFEVYDEALAVTHGELLPFSSVDDEDEYDEYDDEDEDDEED
ncbi:primosomal protein [Timonella sp. A28]|uniref:primosomal protein n=1 Tax=Timonella sp. A28 TaxID=3442640 RepID=UPI003EBE86A1